MKSDREFLDGMWSIVSQMEYEETQLKAAKVRHRWIVFINIAASLATIAAFAFFILSEPIFFENDVYVIAPVLLALVYWIDKLIAGEKKKKSGGAELYEN